MGRVKLAKDLESARLQLLRRRIQKYLPRHPAKYLAGGALVLALGIGALAGIDRLDNGTRLSDAALATTAAFGLAVADIEVEGRGMTAREDILKALGATRGTPILAVDPQRAKQLLETLPWIRSALVERRLPDMIYVRLEEAARPLAAPGQDRADRP